MAWRDYLFDFKGRATRVDFWRFQVVSVLAMGVVMILTVATVNMGGPGFIPFLLSLPVVVAAIAVGVRRLHDRNRRWWWGIIFWIAPFALYCLGYAVAFYGAIGTLISLPLILAGFVLNLWGYVDLGFLRGTPGANRYGPAGSSWPVRKAKP